MIVLSLFDGISCGRAALEKVGVPVDRYYASEIDQHAITVSRKNWPDIVQLGDVRKVRSMIETGMIRHIDLLIGGSPCQGFSAAGVQKGLNDPRSALFWEYLFILRELQKHNPRLKFLLENVKMNKSDLQILNNLIGVKPVLINSALVSAQNRERLYWCNWPISQPADRGIYLRDIIDNGGDLLSENELKYMNRSVKDGRTHWEFKHHSDTANDKSATLVANLHKGVPYSVLVHRVRQLEGVSMTPNGIRPYKNDGRKGSFGEIGTIATPDNKVACLTIVNTPKITAHKSIDQGITYRKLTPIECERLQTLPDDYTAGVSNTQRYKQLGNGWTLEVIAHIFGEMPQ